MYEQTSWARWHMLLILGAQEAEAGGFEVSLSYIQTCSQQTGNKNKNLKLQNNFYSRRETEVVG
jgi:hypothetical protein